MLSQQLPSGHTEGNGKAAFNFSTAGISAFIPKLEALKYMGMTWAYETSITDIHFSCL